MTEALRLLAVFAHPDDESMGMGGTLAKYSAEGVETYLVCASRGERGWFGPQEQNPGLSALGQGGNERDDLFLGAACILQSRQRTIVDFNPFVNYDDPFAEFLDVGHIMAREQDGDSVTLIVVAEKLSNRAL